MTHTFNLSTRKVKTGRDMAWWEKKYKAGQDRSSGFSLMFLSIQNNITIAFRLRTFRDRIPHFV